MGSKNTDNSIEEPSKHQKRKKRRSSSSTSDSSVSIDEKLKEKLLEELKKLKKKGKKKRKKKRKLKEHEEKAKKDERKCQIKKTVVGDLEKGRSFAPMTKEEWEKQRNTIRRVYDEQTGRTRLIRGSGEIVEECVSRERQLRINRQATLKDGEHFQKILKNSKFQ